MPYYLCPIANDQQLDANGDTLSGGKIYTYLAGTTTPVATYTDNTGATPQANPIILNTLGLPASPVWVLGGQSYKLVVKTSADVTLRTIDNVSGINDASNTATADQWQSYANTATYINATSFSVAGNQTSTFEQNRRVKTVNTGGTVYSTISSSSFGAGITTVVLTNDSGSLDSGLSSVSVGLLTASNPSVPATYLKTADAATTYATKAAIQDQTYTAFTTAGTAPNFTLTPSPAWSSYVADKRARVKFHAAGAGSDVLNVSGLGNKNLKQYNSSGVKSSVTIVADMLTDVEYDGTDLVILDPLPPVITGSSITLGTAVATTSGTSVTFTGIPSGVKQLTLMLNENSYSGTSSRVIRLGSGSVQTTGYSGQCLLISNTYHVSDNTSSSGFELPDVANATNWGGYITFKYMGSNLWTCFGIFGKQDTGRDQVEVVGTVTLSGELDRVSLTTLNGTDTFDNGTANISYQS